MNVFESTLTSKFQITLPRKIRELLGLHKKGEKVAFVVDDGFVRVFAKPDALDALSSLSGGKRFGGIIKEVREARKQW